MKNARTSAPFTAPLTQEDEPARTYLPSRVYLKDTDDVEQVLTELGLLHTHALDEWGERERERFYQRATRYTDDDPRPEFPHILRSSTSHSSARYVVMPNGQRVRWVGTTRIETLCHIRETLSLADALTRFARPIGRDLCRTCQGRHLVARPTHVRPSPTQQTAPPVECPKCHVDARGSYIAEDHDTLKCLTCGHHLYRSGPILSPAPATLSESDIALNEERISQTLFREDEADDATDDPETGHDWECEDHQSDTLDYSSSHEIEVDMFEDTPDDEIDMRDVADRLHAPAFALFTHGHAPLRQRLIELMLEGREDASKRTLHWTLAGQLASDGLPPSPQDESSHVTNWINSLSTDDLLSLIGNPDTEHPILAHPQADHFMALDQLTHPLQAAIYYQLRGFRNLDAGTRILGDRHALNPDSLKQFLQRHGTTPPTRPMASARGCLESHAVELEPESAVLTEPVGVDRAR